MKRLLLTLSFFWASLSILFAQVKIGENPQTLNSASLLELESSDKTLVLTRVTQAEMDLITPLPGALLFNTDQACVFQYDGTRWINLCQALDLSLVDNGDGTFTFNTTNGPINFIGTGVTDFVVDADTGNLVLSISDGTSFSVPFQNVINNSFTTEAIVNDAPSIVITPNGNALNFEVSKINGFNNIQFQSIQQAQMGAGSIGTAQIRDGTVNASKIDLTTVNLGTFANTPGFITGVDIVSSDTGNVITDNGGAFYDDSELRTAIAANEAAIAADEDGIIDNEIQNLSEVLTEGNGAGSQVISNLGTPLAANDAATKAYVDATAATPALSDVLAVGADAGNTAINNLGAPLLGTDAATKNYVDTTVAGIDINDGDNDDENELQEVGINNGELSLTINTSSAILNNFPIDATRNTATVNILADDHTIILNNATTTNVTLPAGVIGHTIIIKNNTGNILNILGTSYLDQNNTPSTSLPVQTTIWLQSDGGNWHQIN